MFIPFLQGLIVAALACSAGVPSDLAVAPSIVAGGPSACGTVSVDPNHDGSINREITPVGAPPASASIVDALTFAGGLIGVVGVISLGLALPMELLSRLFWAVLGADGSGAGIPLLIAGLVAGGSGAALLTTGYILEHSSPTPTLVVEHEPRFGPRIALGLRF